MATINGVDYTEVKVFFDDDTLYSMYADSNGKLFYMNLSGDLREWCRVLSSGKVTQMTIDDINPGGQAPYYVIGDREEAGFSGDPNITNSNQTVVDRVTDNINMVIPDGSPRESELTMLGTASSCNGTYLSDNASDNEIYYDTNGRLYAKVDGGYVALYGSNENGLKTILTLDNYYLFHNYNYTTLSGIGNVSPRTINLDKINYDVTLLAKEAGNDSFYYYLKDYELFSVLEQNVFILKKKDGKGNRFYLFKDGKLTHISDLYGDGLYIGPSSGHIQDDNKNSLPYTYDQIVKGKIGSFFNVYRLENLFMPEVKKVEMSGTIEIDDDDDGFVSYTDWGDGLVSTNYTFIFDSSLMDDVIKELDRIAKEDEDLINAIQSEIANMKNNGAWVGAAYDAFSNKCNAYIDTVLRDYVEIIRQMKKICEIVDENGKKMVNAIGSAKNTIMSN